ncbi:MAG: 4-(cytidine 5'-diphospho)-2-C-methyl-D-erythritol kinase [Candidatus Dormibacterales bacterium]
MGLTLRAFAKLNLDLQVLSRRPDGQHEIRTTFQAVSLHDLLHVEAATATSLEVRGLAGCTPDDNLVLQAAAELEHEVGRALPARWLLEKRIPAGAGLGGGSSDAAAALRSLSLLHGLHVDLGPVAERLGADVPFFLRGGAALGEGRGNLLSPRPVLPVCFGIAWPGFTLPTAAVYAAWDEHPGGGENQLQEAAFEVEPELRKFARRLGPRWRMTGSGSAFFAPFDDARSAEAACSVLDCWTAVAEAVEAWA